MAVWSLLILSAFNLIACVTASLDHFTEELLIKPLYTEQLYAYFHFSTIWNTDYEQETCKLFGSY